tara:strand:+ start:168 stop:386 length:219 start_codon:yes stop_codon:yes gene_type:complete
MAKNKRVKSCANALMQLGATVSEVYVSLYDGNIIITFEYEKNKYDITEQQLFSWVFLKPQITIEQIISKLNQ